MRVDQKASFVRSVLPFLFNPQEFERRTETALGAWWPGGQGGLKVWKPVKVQETELLPHVAGYLNSEGECCPTAHLLALDPNTLNSPNGLVGREIWRLILPQKEVRFCIQAVELALFATGVGFLTVRTQPQGSEPDDWYDFTHYFRFLRRQGVRTGTHRRTGKDQTAAYFPSIAGGPEARSDGTGAFGEIVTALLQSCATSGEDQWWKRVFIPDQMMPFVTLYLDGVTEEQVPEAVYRVRNFFYSGQELHPTAEDLRVDDHREVLQITAYTNSVRILVYYAEEDTLRAASGCGSVGEALPGGT